LYGHGAEPVSLCVPAEQVSAAIRHGSRLVDLSGAVSEKALIGDLQWDTYGNDVLHLDFVRVSEGERVTLTVSLETRGEAPGVKEGGVLDLVLHELEIECPVTAIPEKILVNVKELHLEQHLTAGQLTLPPEVTLVTDADVTVVTCHAVSEEGEETAAPGAGEPEIIGRKAEADEEDT
jgi:large subunit ribosomal protein L25